MKTPPLILIAILVIAPAAKAQTSLKINSGLGYLEHFSIGTTLTMKEKTSVSLTYGSNFFYKPRYFSTIFFQADRSAPSLSFGKFIPGAGIKGGHTRFTDKYYRWNIISIVPFLTVSRKLSYDIEIGAETGVAISRIESVTRISYGEIGKYKKFLPEVKIFTRCQLFKHGNE